MKKIVLVVLLFTFIFTLSSCAEDTLEYTYVQESFTLDGDALYHRDYTVSSNCTTFELYPLFQEDSMYYYGESYSSMSGTCSSGLYVMDDDLYVEVFYAFNAGVYDLVQMNALLSDITPHYGSAIVPSEITMAGILAEIEVTEKLLVYNQAVAVENAAKLYCAANMCTLSEELTFTVLGDYLNAFNTSLYDFTTNSGITAVYDGSEWKIYLEKVGTGELEFPSGQTPSLLDETSVIIDIN